MSEAGSEGYIRFGVRVKRRQEVVNRARARIRVIGERADATLKDWKVLPTTWRSGATVRASEV
ncbi:hypothetical protein GCM10027610_015040 [Dactylosporangium cerinum]